MILDQSHGQHADTVTLPDRDAAGAAPHHADRRPAMNSRIRCERLGVDAGLHHFIENEALPGTGVQPAAFWKGLSELAHDLAPRVRELLATRDRIQAEMADQGIPAGGSLAVRLFSA